MKFESVKKKFKEGVAYHDIRRLLNDWFSLKSGAIERVCHLWYEDMLQKNYIGYEPNFSQIPPQFCFNFKSHYLGRSGMEMAIRIVNIL